VTDILVANSLLTVTQWFPAYTIWHW